jgi:hypothetical protein
MSSHPILRRLATGAATIALAAGLGSAVSTASADTTASPISTKMSFSEALGCSGGGNYFWCRG